MRLLGIIGFLLIGFSAFAQMPDDRPRIDDHFQRWKCHVRIDLKEKMNIHLQVNPISEYFNNTRNEYEIHDQKQRYGTRYFENRDGLVATMLKGLMDANGAGGKQITKAFVYSNAGLAKEIPRAEASAKIAEWGLGKKEGSGGEEGGGETETTTEGGGEDDGDTQVDAKALEERKKLLLFSSNYIDIIEDRIFEKNKSDMFYDIQYICLVPLGRDDDGNAFNPNEEKLCFAYDDELKAIFEETQYKNRANDAEYRNLNEILENRQFHGFVTSMHGMTGQNLDEMELFKTKMIEFEHHLWCF